MMQIFDRNGQRKYVTPLERSTFLTAAAAAPERVRTLCETLVLTGCRISEALALTAARVDFADGVIVFESLKKRRRGIFRAVPVPPEFLEALDAVHGIRALHRQPDGGASASLWDWSRTTGWRRVREVMDAAEIAGIHASPKGLRHGFGVKAVTSKIPLNMAQRWLGHANLATTAIYANAIGAEEKQIAAAMWETAADKN